MLWKVGVCLKEGDTPHPPETSEGSHVHASRPICLVYCACALTSDQFIRCADWDLVPYRMFPKMFVMTYY